jgi:hypothetical protein
MIICVPSLKIADHLSFIPTHSTLSLIIHVLVQLCSMKNYLVLSLLVIVLASCDKETCIEQPTDPVHPAMIYKDLSDAVVKYGMGQAIDVDNDGSIDFRFRVELVGDPILQRDRMQFQATSTIKRNLLNDADDQSPMLQKNELIKPVFPGYTWYEISSILLVEKITTLTTTYWQGRWKEAAHHYLPIQVEKSGHLYQGWIEISFDQQNERLLIHRSAICKVEDVEVKAGF